MQNATVNSVGLSLNACIKCNICTSYCPVSAVTDSFPGPKYAAPQSERFRDFGHPYYEDAAGPISRPLAGGQMPDASVDYCSGCRVCNEVCPTGVRIAEINARARARIVAARGLSLRNRLLGRNELLGRIGSIAPRLANFALHNPISRKLAARSVRSCREGPPAPLAPRNAQPLARAYPSPAAAQRPKSRLLPRLRNPILRALRGHGRHSGLGASWV